MLRTNPFPSVKGVAVKSKATSLQGSNYEYTLIMCLHRKAQLNSKCGNGTLSIMDGHDLCSSAAMFLAGYQKKPQNILQSSRSLKEGQSYQKEKADSGKEKLLGKVY